MQQTNDACPDVIVVPYDPLWPDEFERASASVRWAMGSTVLSLHHIGSTSIPGLDAKPVIDMLAIVTGLAELDQRAVAMKQSGYEVMGEFGIEGRRYYRRNDSSGRRTHQIHAFALGSPYTIQHLAFRDYLCAYPKVARQYGELKRRLAQAHPHDMKAYRDGKDSFIQEVMPPAVKWFRASISNSAST